MLVEELLAAHCMLLPSMISLLLLKNNTNSLIATVGVLLHFPFSYALHMHKALTNEPIIRTKLFKLDVIFIHVHAFLTGYSWFLLLSLTELFYHLFCILNIIFSDPLKYPKHKKIIDILCVIGIIKSAFGLIYKSKLSWFCAHLFWTLGFYIYNNKTFGKYSSAVFHIILTIPQYCCMSELFF